MAHRSFDAIPLTGLTRKAKLAFHEQHAKLMMDQRCPRHSVPARIAVVEVAPLHFEFHAEGCCEPFLEYLAERDQSDIVT